MKIKTAVEVLALLSDQAHRQAEELRGRARQPHEVEAAQNWDDIGGIVEQAREKIEALPTRGQFTKD